MRRVEHRDECVGAIQERVGGMAVAAVVAAVEPEGVPCGPINSMEQVFSHPQVHARDMVAEVDHPTAGRIKYGSGGGSRAAAVVVAEGRLCDNDGSFWCCWPDCCLFDLSYIF